MAAFLLVATETLIDKGLYNMSFLSLYWEVCTRLTWTPPRPRTIWRSRETDRVCSDAPS